MPSIIDDILAALRRKESGSYRGDYTAKQSWGGSSASGAYQITKGTWGNYKGYGEARLAPPNIQDEFARRDVGRLLSKYGNDPAKVFGAWYVGERTLSKYGPYSDYRPPKNKETIGQYVSSALRFFATRRKKAAISQK